jgi:hypothetical protein
MNEKLKYKYVNNEILRSILTFNGAGKVSKELS